MLCVYGGTYITCSWRRWVDTEIIICWAVAKLLAKDLLGGKEGQISKLKFVTVDKHNGSRKN